MVIFGKHTVKEPRLWVIRITRLIGFAMVHMMRHDIDLFRNGLDHEVLGDDPPYGMAKAIGFVRAIPVKPDSAMRPHDDHTIYDNRDHPLPGKIPEQEEIK